MSMRVGSSDAFEHLKLGQEASELELKKHSGQAKRFSNEAIKGHPQLGKVQKTLQMIQPDQLKQVLNNAGSALAGLGGTTDIANEELPTLASPQSLMKETSSVTLTRSISTTVRSTSDLSASARMTALLGAITQLSAESTLQSLQGKMQAFNSMMSGSVAAFTAMAKQLEQQATDLATAKDELKEAQDQAAKLQTDINNAQSELNNANSSLGTAQTNLKNAEDKLSALQADSSSSADDIAKAKQAVTDAKKGVDTAQSAVKTAQTKLDTATTTRKDFIEKTLNPAITAEADATKALESSKGATISMISGVSKHQEMVIETKRKETDAESKSLTFLMALIAQLINNASNDDLKATADLKAKLAEASAKDAEKKAKEYEEQVRQAEEMQKTMGCIGKILGWLITAVSFVAAAVTGGASLALAAVGLALAIGDEINQAVNGNSFMADAMQPIMDAIVKPLMELLGNLFTEILKSFGVDEDSAKMAGQIMGAIAAAAVMVGAVIVAGSVLSKVAGVVMKKLGGDVATEVSKDLAKEAGKNAAKTVGTEVEKQVAKSTAQSVANSVSKEVAEEIAEEVTEQVAKKATQTIMKKLMDSAIGQAVKRMSQGMGRQMGMSEAKAGQFATRTNMAVAGAQMANTSIQVAGNIVAADMYVEAAKAKAKMLEDAAMQTLLNEMMDRAITTFEHRMESVNAIVENMSKVADEQLAAGKYITRQMATVAG